MKRTLRSSNQIETLIRSELVSEDKCDHLGEKSEEKSEEASNSKVPLINFMIPFHTHKQRLHSMIMFILKKDWRSPDDIYHPRSANTSSFTTFRPSRKQQFDNPYIFTHHKDFDRFELYMPRTPSPCFDEKRFHTYYSDFKESIHARLNSGVYLSSPLSLDDNIPLEDMDVLPRDYLFKTWLQPIVFKGHMIFVILKPANSTFIASYYICHQNMILHQDDASKIELALYGKYSVCLSDKRSTLTCTILKKRYSQEWCVHKEIEDCLISAIETVPYSPKYIFDRKRPSSCQSTESNNDIITVD